jgi:hypothetical protein
MGYASFDRADTLPGEREMDQAEKTEVLAIDIPEAGRMAGLSPQRSYAAVREGLIPVIRVGKSRMKVPLKPWIAKLNGETA